jgi:hypothetical protein
VISGSCSRIPVVFVYCVITAAIAVLYVLLLFSAVIWELCEIVLCYKFFCFAIIDQTLETLHIEKRPIIKHTRMLLHIQF